MSHSSGAAHPGLFRAGCITVFASLAFACSGAPGDPSTSAAESVNTCPAGTSQVLLWTDDASVFSIAKNLKAPPPCTEYYVSIPLLVADKTSFHPNVSAEIAQVHALGPHFHAVAECHWGSWRDDAVPRNLAWSWSPDGSLAPAAGLDLLSSRLAGAISDSFAHGASYACSPSGAYTDCQCDVPEAAFTEAWHDLFLAW